MTAGTLFPLLAADLDLAQWSLSSRVLIVDSHGIRYLIPDYRTLDATSRRLLERYI